MLRNAHRLAALALAPLALACAGGDKASGTPLSYDGATSISRHVLAEVNKDLTDTLVAKGSKLIRSRSTSQQVHLFLGGLYFGTEDKATGKRSQGREVAVYHVKDGKIVREEFFYST